MIPSFMPSLRPRVARRPLLAAACKGLALRSMKPDELAASGRTEISKWSELVKRSGAQVD